MGVVVSRTLKVSFIFVLVTSQAVERSGGTSKQEQPGGLQAVSAAVVIASTALSRGGRGRAEQ